LIKLQAGAGTPNVLHFPMRLAGFTVWIPLMAVNEKWIVFQKNVN
jgi:hypothetical protein